MMITARVFREMDNVEILNSIEVAGRVLESRTLSEEDKRVLLHLVKHLIEILAEAQ